MPYGKTVNDDPARIKYMSDMKGYSKTRLLPGFDIYEKAKGSLPPHLQNVRTLSFPVKQLCFSSQRQY